MQDAMSETTKFGIVIAVDRNFKFDRYGRSVARNEVSNEVKAQSVILTENFTRQSEHSRYIHCLIRTCKFEV